jgi:hypothetical protein
MIQRALVLCKSQKVQIVWDGGSREGDQNRSEHHAGLTSHLTVPTATGKKDGGEQLPALGTARGRERGKK